jgi:hypothetical protein
MNVQYVDMQNLVAVSVDQLNTASVSTGDLTVSGALTLPAASVTNTMLANPSLTINGSVVPLGGSATVGVMTTSQTTGVFPVLFGDTTYTGPVNVRTIQNSGLTFDAATATVISSNADIFNNLHAGALTVQTSATVLGTTTCSNGLAVTGVASVSGTTTTGTLTCTGTGTFPKGNNAAGVSYSAVFGAANNPASSGQIAIVDGNSNNQYAQVYCRSNTFGVQGNCTAISLWKPTTIGTSLTVKDATLATTLSTIDSTGMNIAAGQAYKKAGIALRTLDIPEVTNLYYTDARAQAAISVNSVGSEVAASYSAGVITVPPLTAGSVALSKLTSGTEGNLIVCDVLGVPTYAPLPLTLSSTGSEVAASYASGVITVPALTTASVALAKLASGTAGNLIVCGALGAPAYAPLPLSLTSTGSEIAASYASGVITVPALSAASVSLAKIAGGTVNQIAVCNSLGRPTYGTVPNASLANSAITLGGTSISLGGSQSTLAGPLTITGTLSCGTLYATSTSVTTQSATGGTANTAYATSGVNYQCSASPSLLCGTNLVNGGVLLLGSLAGPISGSLYAVGTILQNYNGHTQLDNRSTSSTAVAAIGIGAAMPYQSITIGSATSPNSTINGTVINLTGAVSVNGRPLFNAGNDQSYTFYMPITSATYIPLSSTTAPFDSISCAITLRSLTSKVLITFTCGICRGPANATIYLSVGCNFGGVVSTDLTNGCPGGFYMVSMASLFYQPASFTVMLNSSQIATTTANPIALIVYAKTNGLAGTYIGYAGTPGGYVGMSATEIG